MIPAETGTTDSGNAHHHLRGPLRPIFRRLNSTASPQPAQPSRTGKGSQEALSLALPKASSSFAGLCVRRRASR